MRKLTPLAGVVVAAIVATLGAATPARAATPLVALSLGVTPNPAVYGSSVTWVGTVRPVSGVPTNLRLRLSTLTGAFGPGGMCGPAAYCTNDVNGATWVFPTLTSAVTLTFTTEARQMIGRLDIMSDGSGCVGDNTCPPFAELRAPTSVVALSYHSDRPVLPGSVVHVKAVGSIDTAGAQSLEGDVHVDLPTGLDAPSSLTSGAAYAPPPYHYVDFGAYLNPTAPPLEFDSVVNAPVGSHLALSSQIVASGVQNMPSNVTIAVGPDAVRPTTTAVRQSLGIGTALTGGLVPVRLGWTGSDNFSGIERYQLSQSTDGAPWSTVNATLAAPNTLKYLTAGHAYRFRVRAIDHAGNVGTWTYASTFRLATYSEASSPIHYSGSWTTVARTGLRGGKAKASSTAGSRATFTFTGKSFAWIAEPGPARGEAGIYVNGVRVATVNLYSPFSLPQRIVWARSWSTAVSRTIVIRVSGSAGRPRIELDGLVAIR
jgi:hypothetical protein